MSQNCNCVVFSNKAYNAIIRETFDKHPVETGGILLGHVIDGVWVVMEVLPPGIKSTFQYAYFEYDQAFVNYLAQSVANQYNIPLQLLGLWHRHPGSMDVFSSTDDGTNSTFASLSPRGTISALVNVDPNFRMTMYHLDNGCGIEHYNRPLYEEIDIEVGDDIIPEEYFKLKYYSSGESNLHPMPTHDKECASNSSLGSKTTSLVISPVEPSPKPSPNPQPLSSKSEREGFDLQDTGRHTTVVRNKNWILIAIIFIIGLSGGVYIHKNLDSWRTKISELIKPASKDEAGNTQKEVQETREPAKNVQDSTKQNKSNEVPSTNQVSTTGKNENPTDATNTTSSTTPKK